jgi:hypothetical protein
MATIMSLNGEVIFIGGFLEVFILFILSIE